MTHGKHAAPVSHQLLKSRIAQPVKRGAHAAPAHAGGKRIPAGARQGRGARHTDALTPAHAGGKRIPAGARQDRGSRHADGSHPRTLPGQEPPRHTYGRTNIFQPRATNTPPSPPLSQASRPAWRGAHAAARKASSVLLLTKLGTWVAVVLALTWLQITFLHRVYAIPSGSMEHTIMAGDHVYAEKVSYYFHNPSQGDVVTFDDPLLPGRTLIKRCIAVGGQTVDLQDGHVVVDGVPLYEPYTGGLSSEPLSGSDVTYPYTVPEDSLWVMGDNRTNSQDSRYFGAVPASSITGRGALVFWPLEDFGSL